MSEIPDSPPTLLGNALEQALDRAIGSSLDSLELLRQTVRKYSTHQRSRGVPLDQVMVALSGVLMEAEDERTSHAGDAQLRDPELARQLRAWCSEDYSEKS